jgi:hypothetical protein
MYHHLPLSVSTKFTQIWTFGLKIYHLATLLRPIFSVEQCGPVPETVCGRVPAAACRNATSFVDRRVVDADCHDVTDDVCVTVDVESCRDVPVRNCRSVDQVTVLSISASPKRIFDKFYYQISFQEK